MAFNVLVVDDSATMRAVVKRVVEMSGVPIGEFFEAENGKDALALLQDAWVDVILSDINMPEMGGMEFLAELRKNEELCKIPLIFITTESSEARIAEATKLGASGYVTKPFVPETIRGKLLFALEKEYGISAEDLISEVDADDDMDF